MPIYVALLRGINLAGHKLVRMERLRESFVALGFGQVQTYIQSGNVVFKAGRTSPAALSRKIGDCIVKEFGFSSPVVVRTREEMQRAIADNPYLKEPGIDPTRLHVIFLPEVPEPAVLKELAGLTRKPDRSQCLGKEIYLHLPNGFAKSSLTNNPIERRLLKGATTRNWKTVNMIHQMCQDCA